MKNILFSLFLVLSFGLSAQKITFENDELESKGGAILNTGMSGDGGVIVNPSQTGINTSGKALRIAKGGNGWINFPSIVLPAGAPASYAYWRVKCKVLAIANSHYADLIFRSGANSGDAGPEIGKITWANPALNTWNSYEIIISNSTLATIPAGQLVVHLNSATAEYAIDDIEIYPGPNVVKVNTTFEDDEVGSLANVVFNTSDPVGGGAKGGVILNPAKTGINTSNKALRIARGGWGHLNFPQITIAAGAPNTHYYSMIKLKVLLISGTDKDYPNLRFRSATNNTEQGTEIGTYGPWGSAPAFNTWVNCQYIIDNSSLANIPAGMLSIKLEKGELEYAIDDVQLFSTKSDVSTSLKSKNINNVIIFSNNEKIAFSEMVDKVQVYDINSRLVQTAFNVSELETVQFAKGIYVVKTQLNGINSVAKIVK